MNLKLFLFLVGLYVVGAALTTLAVDDDKRTLEQLEKEEAEKKQHDIDEKFLDNYKKVFFGGAEAAKPEEMLSVLKSIEEELAHASDTQNSRSIGRKIFELTELAKNTAMGCNRQSFKRFDRLAEEYKTGYNPAIKEYVLYLRNQFWKVCKNSFLNKLGPSKYPIDDEAKLFPLVDKVLAVESSNNKAHLHLSLKAVQVGLMEHQRVNNISTGDIMQACTFLQFRFINADEIDEIVEAYPDYEAELDARSRKWLTAINVCRVFDEQPTILSL